MNDMHYETAEARKRKIWSDLGPGAHQCWYPVAVSSDVPKGKSIGVDLGDGRIVVYRGEDGTARALSAFCRHMGADLSIGGEVVGNNIRCPYHHWAFGDGGHCKNIPSGDVIPKASNLANLPLKEEFGLVWVFFGETPLYDPPTFEEFDDTKYVFRAFEMPMHDKLLVEPWIFSTNVFDIVHLRLVHGLNIIGSEVEEVSPYHRRISLDAADLGGKGPGTWRVEVDVLGVNCVRTKGEMEGRLKWYIAAQTPSGAQGLRTFMTIITTKDDGAEELLDRAQDLHTKIVNEDIPILNNMRLGDLHLVKTDHAMGRFMRAAREYPRTTLDAMETAANSSAKRDRVPA